MFVLNRNNSIANNYIAELRDVVKQKSRLSFRRNIERLGEILAYELSKSLAYQTTVVTTPLGSAEERILAEQPVLITILRAGVPFYQGFLNVFNDADSGFIGACRAPHQKGDPITIQMDYIAIPPLDNKTVLLIDPMLASGKSIVKTINDIQQFGIPANIHIVAAIAAPEGLDHIKKEVTLPYSLWIGALDEKLNDMAYIVPGLGDAGDLSFGEKI